jgi:short-subunit dehydrogenase
MTLEPHQSARNFLITGASSDIGGTLARYLESLDGVRLLVTTRSKDFKSQASSTRHLSGIDLTREDDLSRIKEAADAFFVDQFTLVHCVGDFWRHKPLVHTEFREIAGMINSHYLTLCGATHALLPVMMARGGGRLVAFSCNSVAYSYPDMAPFTAAKAAVEAFVKCVANEYAQFGIVATALALPTIRTEKVVHEKPTGDHPNYVSPEELAELISRALTSLSGIVNGNVIRLFRHSDTFYGKSYFDRNPRVQPILPATQEGVAPAAVTHQPDIALARPAPQTDAG